MKNAFDILGIETRLVVSDEELRAAFRESGKTAHPDAGGADEEFANLRGAFEQLSSPSRRLMLWLELQGAAPDGRGSVDAGLMDLFSTVGEVTQRAEALIRKREETKSALGLALLENETQMCREAVENANRLVEAAILEECARFPAYESSESRDVDAACKTARNLAFLEKWRAGLRGVFSRLI